MGTYRTIREKKGNLYIKLYIIQQSEYDGYFSAHVIMLLETLLKNLVRINQLPCYPKLAMYYNNDIETANIM